MKYIEMLRKTRVTATKVSKFKNPQIISWHLVRDTNGEPTFTIGLFKTNEWIHSGAYGWKEVYGYDTLIKLLADIHQTLGIPIERFFMMGSTTYKNEAIREAVTSQVTHEERSLSDPSVGTEADEPKTAKSECVPASSGSEKEEKQHGKV